MQEALDNNAMSHQFVPSKAVSHIEDALQFVDELSTLHDQVHVYVTGSLHLVGGVLSFIHPNCYEKTANELQEETVLKQEYIRLNHDNDDAE